MLRDLPILLLVMSSAALCAVDNANVPPGDPGPELREAVPFAARVAVRNPHDRAVRIVQLDATCTCTRMELRDRFLLPGAATELEVAVDHRNRSGEQRLQVTAYVSDPELEPLEIELRWRVRAAVQVDAVPPLDDGAARPADPAWHDVYKLVAHERPDELHRLRKRLRLSCPPGETPAGGLRLEGIDYPGSLWRFESRTLADGAILVTAVARDPLLAVPPGTYDERLVLRTNHPDKPRIEVVLLAILDREAGRQAIDPLLPVPGG